MLYDLFMSSEFAIDRISAEYCTMIVDMSPVSHYNSKELLMLRVDMISLVTAL